MWQWLTANWGWLLVGLLLGTYFAFYVLAIRHQRAPADNNRFKLPCDRC